MKPTGSFFTKRKPHPLNPHFWDRIEYLHEETGELLYVEIVERKLVDDGEETDDDGQPLSVIKLQANSCEITTNAPRSR
jgi:hypothetical protein